MPSLVVTSRKLFKEDLYTSTDHTPATVNQTVGGVGTVALTPVNAFFYSDVGAYANDAAAAAGGLNVGDLYYDSVNLRLRVRMS